MKNDTVSQSGRIKGANRLNITTDPNDITVISRVCCHVTAAAFSTQDTGDIPQFSWVTQIYLYSTF